MSPTFHTMTNHKEHIVSLGQIELPEDKIQSIPKENLSVLATRDFVLFPGITYPISLGRDASIKTAEKAAKEQYPIAILCQKDPATEHPDIPSDLYEYGVAAVVVKVFDLPDGPKTAILHALGPIKVIGKGSLKGTVNVEVIKESVPDKNDKEATALSKIIRDTFRNIINKTTDGPNEISVNLETIESAATVINLVSTQTPLPTPAKQMLLSEPDIKQRGYKLLVELAKSEEMVNLAHDIQERTRQSMAEGQRIAMLQQQMEVIRQEIYGDDDDASMFRRKGIDVAFPKEVKEIFNREVDKLQRLNPQSPDYSVQYSYLDLLLSLPWAENDMLNDNLSAAEEILDNDHYGLEKVKERIVEQLAVMINKPDGKSPIICLVGPPGVGKTSLGQSIARAMNRKYQRVSLGGVHDESEIRGHRRTYIGAMPGRIIDAMKRAGTVNPLIVLDEIDKIGSDIKGDPSAALLEVLDPEQNCHFHDNYVDVDYDLSNVMFIATANTLSTLSQPLLDRMEIIDISGYLLEEKIQIAQRHLIPRVLTDNGFKKKEIKFSDEALKTIIVNYTGESGVRQLEKMIASIVRKLVVRKLKGQKNIRTVKPSHVRELLGLEKHFHDKWENNDIPGIVTGLAWTAVGGEILFIESSKSKSKGEKLTLTGNLGDVMKESAAIALQYIKANCESLDIDPEIFNEKAIHIHVPEGAIPKDGPSAGITIATSLVSMLTGRKVRERLAMTGEITLTGRVLPVGGIKEKILAAKRAGITTIILSADNKRDILDIPTSYLEGLEFIYAKTIADVFDNALI